MNPTITRRFRFPTHVGVLSAGPAQPTPSSLWTPPPLPSDGSARWTAPTSSVTDRPTVSIIRGRCRAGAPSADPA